MPTKHLILGAGTAGVNAIRTLRQLGDTGEILLVAAEEPYARMVLPYYLDGGISESHTTTATPAQLARWGVQTRFGVRAAGLDAQKRHLCLENGEELPYDQLLIATGSRAARAPIVGANSARVHTFWDLADARGLHARIQPTSHVVLIGAGFISFTILNGIIQRAGRVSIVERESRILPRMVDEAGAAMTTRALESQGVEIRCATQLRAIVEHGTGLRLEFDAGETLEADCAVMATGIHPNLDWLQNSGLEIAEGIRVDERMRTNLPSIYAAGDVAQGLNAISGRSEVHAIEPTAMEHGRIAAANMAGQELHYSGSLMMNIVGVAGLNIASFGEWSETEAEMIVAERPERRSYRKYILRDDTVCGAVYVGDDAETWSGNTLGMLKGIVQSQLALGEWKDYLRKNPFDLKPAYLALGAVSQLLPRKVLSTPSLSPVR